VLGTARELCQLSAGMRGRSLTRSRSTGRVFQRIVQLIDDFQDDIQPLTF